MNRLHFPLLSFGLRVLVLAVALTVTWAPQSAWAEGGGHDAAPAAEGHGGGEAPKGAPKGEISPTETVQVPRRTFEGQEPLFYLDSERRPFIEPLRKNDVDSYYICRGTVGHWFRELVAQEASMLAQRNGFDTVGPELCALRLVETHSGKKRPIISVELYLNNAHMQTCILTESCPNARSAIMYVRNKTLYRSYVIGDAKLGQVKEYCLDNRSKILATTPCWKHFAQEDEDKHKAKHDEQAQAQAQAEQAKSQAEQAKAKQQDAQRQAEEEEKKLRAARRAAREKDEGKSAAPEAPRPAAAH